MSKIKILTPVHIGNGNKYYVAEVKDNYIYTIDNVLKIMNEKDLKNPSLIKGLQKKNLSRKEFLSNFKYDSLKLSPDNSYCKVKDNVELIGNVYEQSKENDKLLIPGSSIKGYISNLMYYDIICNNSKIKQYLEDTIEKEYKKTKEKAIHKNIKSDQLPYFINKEISKKLPKILDELTKESKHIMNLIGFRDIYFNNDVSFEKVRKMTNAKNSIEVYECIPIFSECNTDLMFSFHQINNNFSKSIKDEISNAISKTKDYYLKSIKYDLLDELYKRIINFEKWIIISNRQFMNQILEYEMDFAINTKNINVNKTILINKIEELKQLNKNSLILQIGKNTNYILKTITLSLTNICNKYFIEIFSPDPKRKKSLDVRILSLVDYNNMGVYPFGFIQIEL